MNRCKDILLHMREDCVDIRQFIEGMTEDEFANNKLVRNAVGMSLINIGELVKALPMDFREEHSKLPWRRIAGMRDLAAHKYQALDISAIWNVAKNRVPEIMEFIDEYIKTEV